MELEQLMKMLAGFVMFAAYQNKEGFKGSMYGYQMDTAVAKDLMTILVAYGADLQTYMDTKKMLVDKGLWNA